MRGRSVEALPLLPFPVTRRVGLLLAAGVALQLGLAALLGHANDMRIFMATGYLVATGHDPYTPRDLMYVFHHALFGTHSTIGYPPPWPLLLGVVYRATYQHLHSLLVYGVAIRLPVIAANAGLAWLAALVVRRLGSSAAVARRAWLFLWFNPLLLYFTAAWGQIDGIVALLALGGLWLLVPWNSEPAHSLDPPGADHGHPYGAALLLAMAVCVKPVALPLALAAGVYLQGRSPRRAVRFGALFVAGVAFLYVAPFILFRWDPAPATSAWHKVWDMSGTLSAMTVLRLVRDPFPLRGAWWLLGLAWAPALAAAALVALRRRLTGAEDLLAAGLALLLVFFLTRTWLSEGNIVVALPLALILTVRGRLDRRLLLALWVVPLLFTVAGWTPLQLLWADFPGAMDRAAAAVAPTLPAVRVARAALVVVWQAAGWWIVVSCLRRRSPVLAPNRAQVAAAGPPSLEAPG